MSVCQLVISDLDHPQTDTHTLIDHTQTDTHTLTDHPQTYTEVTRLVLSTAVLRVFSHVSVSVGDI